MPCATVHLVVADRIWTRWSSEGGAPFALGQRTRDAFIHGSLAPDLGFIPGVDRIISELAHYYRPADLSRSLLARAASPEERAFAWGWVAHVVGDMEIHPLVGRAVGERVHGDRAQHAHERGGRRRDPRLRRGGSGHRCTCAQSHGVRTPRPPDPARAQCGLDRGCTRGGLRLSLERSDSSRLARHRSATDAAVASSARHPVPGCR